MTEAGWLGSGDPLAMLRWLGGPGSVSGNDPEGRTYWHRVTDRKLRLFACAAARRCREAKDLMRTVAAVESAADAAASANVYESIAAGAVTGGCEWLAHADAVVAAGHWAARKINGTAALLRDVIGNPWRPIASVREVFKAGVASHAEWERLADRFPGGRIEPRWLTPTVLAVAGAVYDERPGLACGMCDGTGRWADPNTATTGGCSYCRGAGRIVDGTLDPVNLSVLADALEDAGCDAGELLGHLRSPGPHVRGCWAVDLVVGKE